jgi:hypothetical protein
MQPQVNPSLFGFAAVKTLVQLNGKFFAAELPAFILQQYQ